MKKTGGTSKKGSARAAKRNEISLALVRRLSRDGKKNGAMLDAAILQRVREVLWHACEDEEAAEKAKGLLLALVAARRAALAERLADEKAREASEEKKSRFTKKKLRKLLGLQSNEDF
jgi:hypothetical protein